MNGLKFCSFAILFLGTCFGVVRSQAPPQSLELIQAANAASDLSNIGPYRLDAEVIVNNGHGGQTRGRLTIFKDHERSRTEFAWGNYKELIVVLSNKLYDVRNAPGPPRELHGLPDVRWLWRVLLSPRDKLSQPFTLDFRDMKANCVAVEAGYEISRYCFDPSTKVLIESAWAKHKERATGGTWYFDYRQTEGQHYPGTIRRFSKGGAVTGPDIGNIQVVPTQVDPVLFSVPANAREFETCDDMQKARLTKREDPMYPLEAKLAHLQGEVYIAAVIGDDGRVEDLRPVSGSPVLIQASLDAIKQWRYSPAMCGTKPVAVRTELLVEFRM